MTLKFFLSNPLMEISYPILLLIVFSLRFALIIDVDTYDTNRLFTLKRVLF